MRPECGSLFESDIKLPEDDHLTGTEGFHVDDPESGISGIGRKARRGLGWSLAGNVAIRLSSFALGLLLARILSPADFGVFALALAVMSFALNVNDAGIISACLQWRGKLEDIAPTATLVAVLISTAFYGTLWICAPSIATMGGIPGATPVIRLLCVKILFDGFTSVRWAAINRRFQQRRLMAATLVGAGVNACAAIPLALAGSGPYSLAIGQVAGSLVSNLLLFRMAGLPIRFGFDTAIARQLLKFGLPLAAGLGFTALLLNTDYVIVGNLLGAEALGFYLLAFNASSWVPGLVSTAIRYVSIPSFSRLAEHSTEALNKAVSGSISLLLTAVLPFAAWLTILAPQVIQILYGGKWAPSADPLRYLGILMVIRMLSAFTFDILTSIGSTVSIAVLNAGWTFAVVPALFVGVRLDGIGGAAKAHAIIAVTVAVPLMAYLLSRAGVAIRPIPKAMVRPAIGMAFLTFTCLLMKSLLAGSPVWQTLTSVVVGGTVYVLVVVPLGRLRFSLNQVIQRL